MKLVVVASLIFSFVCSAQTVNPKFFGSWRENEAKRHIGASVPLRFQRNASGATEELRGPEGKPLVQPVHFGNKAYAVDNSRNSSSGNSIEWRQADANHFERRLYQDGNILTIRRIAISVDGKTLTEATERTPADVTTTVFKRISGDTEGLIGIWQAASTNSTKPATLKVAAHGATALRLTDDRDVVQDLTFDGRLSATTGPAVISGTMTTSKLLNTTRIEVTNSRDGVVTGTVMLDLSSDGKTLTETSRLASGGQPSIRVYDKQ